MRVTCFEDRYGLVHAVRGESYTCYVAWCGKAASADYGRGSVEEKVTTCLRCIVTRTTTSDTTSTA